jgi:hypothetical protein
LPIFTHQHQPKYKMKIQHDQNNEHGTITNEDGEIIDLTGPPTIKHGGCGGGIWQQAPGTSRTRTDDSGAPVKYIAYWCLDEESPEAGTLEDLDLVEI